LALLMRRFSLHNHVIVTIFRSPAFFVIGQCSKLDPTGFLHIDMHIRIPPAFFSSHRLILAFGGFKVIGNLDCVKMTPFFLKDVHVLGMWADVLLRFRVQVVLRGRELEDVSL